MTTTLGELFSSDLDVTDISDHAAAVNNAVGDDTTVEKLFPTDDSTLSTHHPTYVTETTSEANAVGSNEQVTVPDSIAETETFDSTTDLDTEKTVCFSSDSSVKGKPCAHHGGGHHTGGGSGVGTQVMITVHSSPGRIARITDAFQGIKKRHALIDAKLQLNTYVSMADDYIIVPKQESKGDMSEETCEPKSTDRSDTTLSTEITSDAIKDISKSDSSASDVTIKMETPSEGDTTVDPNLTQNDTVPDSDMTVDPNQSIGDPPKKVDGDIDGTNTMTETPTPHDDNKEETKNEVVTPDDTPP